MNKNEWKEEECRVCKKHTKQIFNIDFKQAYICRDCECRIVKQSISHDYSK